MSLCLSASSASPELGAIAQRPTPIARLLHLFRPEPLRGETASPTDKLDPVPRAPVNVLLL